MEKSQEVDRKYEKFKTEFNKVLGKIMQNLRDQANLEHIDEDTLTHKPMEGDIEQAVSMIKGKKHVLIITGQGLA